MKTNLSRRIAELKGLNYQVIDGEAKICPPMMRGYTKTYDPETNKEQAFDLLIELKTNGITESYSKYFEEFVYSGFNLKGYLWEVRNKNPLIAICKAWLSAFGGE